MKVVPETPFTQGPQTTLYVFVFSKISQKTETLILPHTGTSKLMFRRGVESKFRFLEYFTENENV